MNRREPSNLEGYGRLNDQASGKRRWTGIREDYAARTIRLLSTVDRPALGLAIVDWMIILMLDVGGPTFGKTMVECTFRLLGTVGGP